MSAKTNGKASAANPDHEALGLLLAQFYLTSFRGALPALESQADAEGWSYRHFLRQGLEIEAHARDERKLQRLRKEAQLPEGKTLAALDPAKLSTANRRHLEELCGGGFIDRAENVLAFGLPGRGKTHYLSAIGHELIYRQQRRVWFTPTYKLVQRLLEAKRELRLEALLRKLDLFEVIILDDLGYLQQSREEMEVLFTFFAERYERRCVMISSNLVFSKWEQIFHDPMTAMAAIDRLVHHSVILEFGGESHRSSSKTKPSCAPPA
jgi:DNA replication protein DnaC